jgi:hypothetical protein
MLRRVHEYVQGHPRVSGGLTLAGLVTMLVGASGHAGDVAGWGDAFAAIGSDLGRWVLVALGFVLAVVPQLLQHMAPSARAPRGEKARLPTPAQDPAPAASTKLAEQRVARREAERQDVTPPVSPPAQTGALRRAMAKSAKNQQLRDDLQGAYNEGYAIRQALPRRGMPTFSILSSPATEQDVENWEANVEHLLADHPKLVAVFRYRPLPPPPVRTLAATLSSILSEPERRMGQRLAQLEKIIKGL